jgi:hypothetical protein
MVRDKTALTDVAASALFYSVYLIQVDFEKRPEAPGKYHIT